MVQWRSLCNIWVSSIFPMSVGVHSTQSHLKTKKYLLLSYILLGIAITTCEKRDGTVWYEWQDLLFKF